MKGRVLVTMPFNKKNSYVASFKKIVEDTDPRLTVADLEAVMSRKPVLGRVMPDIFGYKKVLEMARMDGFSTDNYTSVKWLWLQLANATGNYSLSIGYDRKKLDIFQEKREEPVSSIALVSIEKKRNHEDEKLEDYNYNRNAETQWLPIDSAFLGQTRDLLGHSDRERFKYLFEDDELPRVKL